MAEAASRQEKEAAESLNLLEEQEKQWQQQAEKLSDTDSPSSHFAWTAAGNQGYG